MLYLDFVTQKLQLQQMIIIALDEIPLPQNVISLNLVTLSEVTNRSQKSLEGPVCTTINYYIVQQHNIDHQM